MTSPMCRKWPFLGLKPVKRVLVPLIALGAIAVFTGCSRVKALTGGSEVEEKLVYSVPLVTTGTLKAGTTSLLAPGIEKAALVVVKACSNDGLTCVALPYGKATWVQGPGRLEIYNALEQFPRCPNYRVEVLY